MTVEMQLLERAAERDPRRFADLYDRYVDKIYKYFYYTTRTINDAKELTAQVLSRARQEIENSPLEGEPLAIWLYRLAHNQFIDYCRAHHQTKPMANAPMLASANDLPVTAELACTTSQIHAALQQLTPNQQEVIVMRFLKGYSTAKVAVIMDQPPDVIRAIQQGALQALQSWLG